MTRPVDTVLFREATEPDPYEGALAEAGFRPVSIPVLRFDFVNQTALRAALEAPDAYGGLILTSPRAVEALGEVLPWLPAENARWHSRPVFVVGPATAARARRLGFDPEGEASGSAELLADYITRRSWAAPLLFLCSNRRRDVLPDRLAAAAVPVEELCVYETHPRTDLDLAAYPGLRWAVFFSPSGIEAAVQARGIDWRQVHKAAIGPTTAEALAARGWSAAAVAAEPTPEALVRALRRETA